MKRHDAALPLYKQVKEHLARQIEDGSYKPGERVPSEHALVARLGVSRMTVNRAIRELTAEGWLTRVPGVGTFVAEPKSQSALFEIRPITEEIAERGGRHSARIVEAGVEKAGPEIAHRMGLMLHEEVFHVVLVHCENGRPIQVEDRCVNPKLAPAFLDQDFLAITPSQYLLTHVPYSEMEHIIESKTPSERECALLEIEASQPCLILNRRTWSGETVVTSVRFTHPGGSYRLGSRIRLERRPFSLVA
jgi:GntR family histidine utilization transcriptional repressor